MLYTPFSVESTSSYSPEQDPIVNFLKTQCHLLNTVPFQKRSEKPDGYVRTDELPTSQHINLASVAIIDSTEFFLHLLTNSNGPII